MDTNWTSDPLLTRTLLLDVLLQEAHTTYYQNTHTLSFYYSWMKL